MFIGKPRWRIKGKAKTVLRRLRLAFSMKVHQSSCVVRNWARLFFDASPLALGSLTVRVGLSGERKYYTAYN